MIPFRVFYSHLDPIVQSYQKVESSPVMTDFSSLATDFLRLLAPETAHRLTVRLLAAGLGPQAREAEDSILESHLWGRRFANPIGMAAGFDKNAEACRGIFGLGFGFAEIGSVTPRPQPGNPKPRLFRLSEDRAIINRMGFNNDGVDRVASRLSSRGVLPGPLGVNLGKNKDSADAAADYVAGVQALARHADYLVVNVSSPNTPGLRALQGREPLAALIAAVKAARDRACPEAPPPLLVKIAPDLQPEDKQDIAAVAMSSGLDGLIVSNTTIARPASLKSPARNEAGGLSGAPLFQPSTDLLAEMYRLTQGRLPLVGVGGVASGADAYAKIRAGASLVQLYSALVYEGPGLVGRIKRELAEALRRDGFSSLAQAVGSGQRPKVPAGPAA
jgi:dihydroorotate dehydrogenase